ncbi:MAG: hypothetical protein NW201_03845, partial [Gemmatimonadales bacterium]|nr:hypothetical protein [Gemmatimonadales bacterium]
MAIGWWTAAAGAAPLLARLPDVAVAELVARAETAGVPPLDLRIDAGLLAFALLAIGGAGLLDLRQALGRARHPVLPFGPIGVAALGGWHLQPLLTLDGRATAGVAAAAGAVASLGAALGTLLPLRRVARAAL